MRKGLIGLLVCFGLIGCAAMDAKSGKAGEQSKHMLNKKITRVVDCNYLLYLPADYGKSKEEIAFDNVPARSRRKRKQP